MLKVKLFKIFGTWDDEGDRYNMLTESVSQWEEVSEEDFKFIKDNLNLLKKKDGYDVQQVLVVQRDGDVKEAFTTIRAEIEKIQKAERRAKEDREKKKREAETKKAEKAKQKELETLKKLQDKYREELYKNV